MSERHRVIEGKAYVYRREESPNWQCAVFLSGRNHRRSTGSDNLALAMAFARDWYEDRAAEDRMRRRGILPLAAPPTRTSAPARGPGGMTFEAASQTFLQEFQTLVGGERNPLYVASKAATLRRHLLPFFGELALPQIDGARVQDYRIHRLTPPRPEADDAPPRRWKRPCRSTLHKEIVCLRQVLKTALRRGWLTTMPDLSEPYRASNKVSHRAWFTPDEYRRLYEATRARARKPVREKWRAASERLHDYVLFMVNTGLRPDECALLQYRDVTIVEANGAEPILEIVVRGKRGVGYCKSMPGAVRPFERMRDRGQPRLQDLVFGKMQRGFLNRILHELDLKTDREGRPRTAYSLRHTYICLRLMEGADIYQVAKNCRTSVEMIQKFYAAHLKDELDALAINVRRGR
ncbi:tyrosine-type recombinase/integrase [Phenylobacterium sp.]|uniref:tyrosine-type recombinase/integrase n=1 Tax=Phenylobacterium sp. TaxID=1871053 RepID=UPI003BAD581E